MEAKIVSLRRSSRPRYDPCSGRTWGKLRVSAQPYCTECRNQLAWASCGDGFGGDRCVNLNGVALVRPWQVTLKNSNYIYICKAKSLLEILRSSASYGQTLKLSSRNER